MNQKGLTLVELLVAFCISAVIMAGMYQVFVNQAKTYVIQEALADAQNEVLSGIQLMIDDLRMTGYDKEGGGSNVTIVTSVPIHTSNSIRVEWEYDNDTIKAVQYLLSNGKLVRNIYLNNVLTDDSPQEVLDATELTFNYRTSGSKIVMVDVTLAAVQNRTLVSSIIFRNVK